jgi:hypothetical protein
MAQASLDLSAFVGMLLEEQNDVLREAIRVLAKALMETEVAGLIGAERYERWVRSSDGCSLVQTPPPENLLRRTQIGSNPPVGLQGSRRRASPRHRHTVGHKMCTYEDPRSRIPDFPRKSGSPPWTTFDTGSSMRRNGARIARCGRGRSAGRGAPAAAQSSPCRVTSRLREASNRRLGKNPGLF